MTLFNLFLRIWKLEAEIFITTFSAKVEWYKIAWLIYVPQAVKVTYGVSILWGRVFLLVSRPLISPKVISNSDEVKRKLL